jgi:hypothetical protein
LSKREKRRGRDSIREIIRQYEQSNTVFLERVREIRTKREGERERGKGKFLA